MMINATSREFPLKSQYGNLSPKHAKAARTGLRIFSELKNGFNHESPDFLKIDSMQEIKSSYRNPFLGEIKKEDRSLYLKNINKTREQISVLDKLKSRREFSQNPSYLKYVTNSYDAQIELKRNGSKIILHNQGDQIFENDKKKNFYTLRKSYDPEMYKKKIKTLDGQYSPKIYFSIKNSLQFEPNDYLQNCETPLQLNIDPKKSSYLKNFNDFNLNENLKENQAKFFNFKKKEVNLFDPIADRIVTVKPDNFKSPKWDTFYEK
jgi:hypothetical protein